ncbi:MAG TPA: hypothetical protein VNK95_14785, partial [Caldilineaceae bacterium]|nr:hypothetical protein [Caldilineaceae bacterium]
LEAIPLPIDLWHGEDDRNAPPAMGRYLASKLRHSRLHLYPNEGHFSLAVRHMPAILRTLMAG